MESASAINHLPLAGDVWEYPVGIEGRPLPARDQSIGAVYRVCRPKYFRTMGLALLRGRDFNEQDDAGGIGVAIINERFAQSHWPNEDPLGKRVTIDDPRSNPKWLTIVGVVKNARQGIWTDDPGNEVYLPFKQSTGFFGGTAGHFAAMTLVIRAAKNPLGFVTPVQYIVWSMNRDAPISSATTLEQVVANAVWQPRFNLILIGLFGGLALLLGAVGIYGVMAYSVTQRTHEIGIRMALGAGKSDVIGLVVSNGMRLALAGIAIGLAGGFALTRVMSTLLYQVKPSDPVTFIGVSLLLVAVAFFACWLPARRATKVDPLIALRHE